jgi:hypothetical protein
MTMRVSANETDPGYVADRQFFRIFLNGDGLRGVMTADDDQGFVEVVCHDDHGRVAYTTDGLIQTKILRGKVRIFRKP